MAAIGKALVGILCIVMIGAVWVMCQKLAAVTTGQARGRIREELLEIGIGIIFVAVLMGITFAIASFAGV